MHFSVGAENVKDDLPQARAGREMYSPPSAEQYAPVLGHRAFDAAIRLLYPSQSYNEMAVQYQGRHATLRRLFPRAAWETIRSWRKGHRKPPEYARDILVAKLDVLSQQAADIAKALREQK